MKMKLILLAAIAFLSLNVYSQKVCTQKRTSLPAVRGLKLDMPKAAVLKIYPAMQLVNKAGVQYGTIGKAAIKDAELQKGVETITVVFAKDALASAMITYDQNDNWLSATDFTEYVGESLDLPLLAWTGAPDRKMTCADFVVSGRLNKNNRAVLLLIKPENELKLPRQ